MFDLFVYLLLFNTCIFIFYVGAKDNVKKNLNVMLTPLNVEYIIILKRR